MIRPGSDEAYSRPGPAAAIASSRAKNTRLVVASRMAGPGCHPTPRLGWSTQRRAMLTKWASTPCTGIVHRRWGRSSAAPGKRSRTSAGIVSGRSPRSSGRSARSSINWTPSRNREIASPCRSANDMSTPARSSRTRICLAHALSVPRVLARQSSQVTRGRDARRRPEPGTRPAGQPRRVPTARWCRPGHDGPCRCWSLSPARRRGHSPTPAPRRRAPSGASYRSRRCRPPPPAPPIAPSNQATASAASEPSMRRSPDHVHVPCAGTSGTHPPVPAGPRCLFGHRPRGGAAPPKATTDVQRSSCSSIPAVRRNGEGLPRQGTSITIVPSPGVSVAICRFPAFEAGSVDRTGAACRRVPAEPEILPGNGGVPSILAMACGNLGAGNAADRPGTAGPAGNGRTVTPIRTAGGGNTAVLSPLSSLAVPLLLKPRVDMVRSQTGRRALHDDRRAAVISSWPGRIGRPGCGLPCRFFIRPGQEAARARRRRSRWGSGCLPA